MGPWDRARGTMGPGPWDWAQGTMEPWDPALGIGPGPGQRFSEWPKAHGVPLGPLKGIYKGFHRNVHTNSMGPCPKNTIFNDF